MEKRKLRVLIVSRIGAHQKAIEAMCASFPQFTLVDTIADAYQAIDAIERTSPDLVIFGANLDEQQVCGLLNQVNQIDNRPYCVILTHMGFTSCLNGQNALDQVVPTRNFAIKLPEILTEMYAHVLP